MPRTHLRSPVARYLQELVDELAVLDDGDVATYIPELGKADPNLFGIALVTIDGSSFDVGDSDHEFTIQSISKPFVFGMALERHGRAAVMQRVGVEPSGDAFNAIGVDTLNRPFNPMVNAGAIVTTSMLEELPDDGRPSRQTGFDRFAGRELVVDQAVYASESATGDRNRALAYLMRSFGMIDVDVDAVVERYFRQCSLLVSCRDLAVMAATLANRGVNPVTGERALDDDCVQDVLSVMSTCGMYDYAGEWAYRVGLPAKSGVAGGVVAVLPGQFGIGVFSPPLDAKGNSVRGIEACRRLAADFSLHPLRFRPRVTSVIRRTYRATDARSTRARTRTDDDLLNELGTRVLVYELEGDLYFGSMEHLFRSIATTLDATDFIVLDCKRLGSVDDAAHEMLLDLHDSLHDAGVSLILSYVEPAGVKCAHLAVLSARGAGCFADTDGALEHCEDTLLAATGAAVDTATSTLADQELLQGFTVEQLAAVEQIAATGTVRAGDVIITAGDVGDAVFFVLAGSVTVRVGLGDGRSRRLSTLGPGVAFGEMALLDSDVRSADVVADDDAVLARVGVSDLRRLGAEQPDLIAAIYRNVAANLARRLRAANAQVRALEQ